MIDQILCCDYKELLSKIADNSVAAVITDPPFGIDYQNNFTHKMHGKIENDAVHFDYTEWAREAYRILRPDSALFAFTGWSEYPLNYKEVESVGFAMKEPIICQKRASGKALALDTPIPTPEGWKTMGQLRVGDYVFDENGKICKIVFVTEPMHGHDCYKVGFSDGECITADADHIWLTQTKNDLAQFKKGKVDKSYFLRTTNEIKSNLYIGVKTKEKNHTVPFAKAIDMPEVNLPIHPFILGYWLGDGNRRCWGKLGISKPLQTILRTFGLLKNKHIPTQYLRSNFTQRMELLKGLMDTDGYISKQGECVFTNTNKELAYGALELVRSLGFKALIHPKKTKCKLAYNVHFFSSIQKSVFKLNRKRSRERQYLTKVGRRKIVSIEPTLSVPVRCIQVDSESNLYLIGNSFIPTHNTDLYGTFQTNSDWIMFAHKGRFRFRQTQLVKNKRAGTVPNKGRKPVPFYKKRLPSCWFGTEYPWSSENSAFQKKHNIYHPTIKGLTFIEWLILISTDEGDIIVDPFCGSGTTAVAAKKHNRRFICCDISQEHCDTAKGRL